jgi:hypothetical protein
LDIFFYFGYFCFLEQLKTKQIFVSANINFEAASTSLEKSANALVRTTTEPGDYESYDFSADDARVTHQDSVVFVDLRKNPSTIKVPKTPLGNDDAAYQQLQLPEQGTCVKISCTTISFTHPICIIVCCVFQMLR